MPYPSFKTKGSLLLLLLAAVLPVCSQQQEDSLLFPSPSYLKAVEKKTGYLSHRVQRTNEKLLTKWERQQARVLRKLESANTEAAAALRTQLAKRKAQLQQQLTQPGLLLQEYIPILDSLQTSLNFFNASSSVVTPGSHTLRLLPEADNKLKALRNNLSQAELIQKAIGEQQQLVKERLQSFNMPGELKALNKTAYYYQAQIAAYKSLLKDRKKAVRKGLALLQKSKPFQEFMRRNSQLASLFRLPADPNDPAQSVNLANLQTRAQVNGLIRQRIAGAGPNAAAQLRANMADAQGQLRQLKDKIITSGGSSSDFTMPEGFRANPYKTKSFLQRLDIGVNIQSQRARGWLPTRSDVGVSVGYKFTPGIIAGIGGSYRVGWGRDIRHIRISHQGLSMRSYVDVKLKGSFWLTGGYERNQNTRVNEEGQPAGSWQWQSSGLIGISKVVDTRSRLLKKTRLMLLWDFLSYSRLPRTQPVVFRIGYSF